MALYIRRLYIKRLYIRRLCITNKTLAPKRSPQGTGGMPGIFTAPVKYTIALADEPDVEGFDMSYLHGENYMHSVTVNTYSSVYKDSIQAFFSQLFSST